MSDIVCITNRKLCKEEFLERIEEIAKAKPFGIILREKDLSDD
jgi:thiamine-phosphate pyrophosphorylase